MIELIKTKNVGRFFNLMIFLITGVIMVSFVAIFFTADLDRSEAISGITQVRSEDGGTAISFVLSGAEDNGKSLCFKSKSSDIVVFAGDTIIYDYAPGVPRIYGGSYGEYYHIVHLPDMHEISKITVLATPESGNSKCYVGPFYLSYSDEYVSEMFVSNLGHFIISAAVLIMGIGLIASGCAVVRSTSLGTEIIAMGAFAFLSAVWTMTQTMFLQMILKEPAAVHFLNYVSLILLPGAGNLYVAHMTDNRDSIILKLLTLAAPVTLFVDITLNVMGVTDYHSLLIITHIQLVATAVCSFWFTAKAIRKDSLRVQKAVPIIGFAAVIIGGIIDLSRYVFLDAVEDTALFFRYGLLTFILIMGFYDINEIMNFRKYEFAAEHFRDMAHSDALTGLPNRLAYLETEKEMERGKVDKAVMVQLDVNSLKEINDRFGHSLGDRRIIAAAGIIGKTFGKIGTCFRTGGDEFIVVIEGDDCEERYDDMIPAFEKRIREYNEIDDSEVSLQIAYGKALFEKGVSTPSKVLREADLRMYDMKHKMKRA